MRIVLEQFNFETPKLIQIFFFHIIHANDLSIFVNIIFDKFTMFMWVSCQYHVKERRERGGALFIFVYRSSPSSQTNRSPRICSSYVLLYFYVFCRPPGVSKIPPLSFLFLLVLFKLIFCLFLSLFSSSSSFPFLFPSPFPPPLSPDPLQLVPWRLIPPQNSPRSQ